MPIRVKYGPTGLLADAAVAAGQQQDFRRQAQMDQQFLQGELQRRQQARQQNLQNQLEYLKQSQQTRVRSGLPPNRARVFYPNRPAGGGASNPLEDEVRRSAERRRQQMGEPIQNESGGFIFGAPPEGQRPQQASPYQTEDGEVSLGATPAERENYATFTSGDTTRSIEGDEIVTRRGGEVVERTPAAQAPGQQLSRRGQSKIAAMEAAGASDLLNERQLAAVRQMAGDDEIDIQEFRQWLGQAIRTAETQRQREAERQGAGGPASMADPSQLWQAQYYTTADQAEKVNEEVQQLYTATEAPRPDMTEEEYRNWLRETKGVDTGYMDFTGELTPDDLEERVRMFKRFKQKRQQAEKLNQRLRTLRGEEQQVQLPTGNGEKLNKEQARKFMRAAGGDAERARQLAREHGFKF